jgi:hypothetical protein
MGTHCLLQWSFFLLLLVDDEGGVKRRLGSFKKFSL